jgi:hypothetical protein
VLEDQMVFLYQSISDRAFAYELALSLYVSALQLCFPPPPTGMPFLVIPYFDCFIQQH